MTELILIRHGQTELNRGPFFQGQIDVPLNALGLAQAARLAERLAGERIEAIACSDLIRTRQTAAPAAGRLVLDPVPDAGLREQAFGAFEGLSFDDCIERHPEAFAAWQRHDPAFATPGGESVLVFHSRVLAAVRAVASRHAGRRVAVVTHGGVLDMVWRTARGLPLSGPRTCAIPNTGLSRVRIDGDAIEILGWADDAHVADLVAAPTPAPTADAAAMLQAPIAPSTPSAR
ncbi:MAG: histidine phosphatase family protein [Burkholderiales bacterium]|jgi:probable phosphoglycerate mutase